MGAQDPAGVLDESAFEGDGEGEEEGVELWAVESLPEVLAGRDDDERFRERRPLDLLEQSGPGTLAEASLEDDRGEASASESLGEQVAVLFPLAQYEAPSAFSERGADVVANEGVALLVLSTWSAREAEERQQRACFAFTGEDADAARAFGCLLELPGPDGRREHRYVTDPEWIADRLVQKIAAYATAEAERETREGERRAPAASPDDAEKEARRQERQRQYDERTSARARNLDLGAALARWQPKLDTDAVKLLGSLVLLQHGKGAAWAHRLCIEQPTTTNKQGKVTVRYPRGAQAEKQLHEDALAALKRAGPPRLRSPSSSGCSSRRDSPTRRGWRMPTGRASTSRRSWPDRPCSASSQRVSRRPR